MKKLALKMGGNALTKEQMQNISGGDNQCTPYGCACYCDDEVNNPFFVACSNDAYSCSYICTTDYGRPFQYCIDW